jgi:Ca2+-binding EF-hand superfamily protein
MASVLGVIEARQEAKTCTSTLCTQESAEWADWVAKGFEAFDVDGNGSISAKELSAILCKDGVCAMPDIVSAALRCVLHAVHA